MSSKIASIEKVFWEDIRNQIMDVNPTLSHLIDNISPGRDLYFYRAKYPYGNHIVKEGKFQCPDNKGGFFEFTDKGIDPEIYKDLSYNYPDTGGFQPSFNTDQRFY